LRVCQRWTFDVHLFLVPFHSPSGVKIVQRLWGCSPAFSGPFNPNLSLQ
jgi:hypothetical protein